MILMLALIISAGSLETSCDRVYNKSLQAQSIQRGDSIFVKTTSVADFFLTFFDQIIEPFILVSGGGVGTIDKSYVPYLNSDRLVHWFGNHMTLVHPKATPIPLGAVWYNQKSATDLQPKYDRLERDFYFRQKLYGKYLNWTSLRDPSREAVFNHFVSQGDCKISRALPFKKYLAEIENSRFVISPRGINIDCFRTWESLYLGSIPVVQSYGIDAVYKDLPVIIVDNLTTVTDELLTQEYEHLKTKKFHLEKLDLHYWMAQISEKQIQIKKQNN